MINFNDLLRKAELSPEHVLVFRNSTANLGKAIYHIADERPDLFRAYQHTQGDRVQGAMTNAKVVASFIGHIPKAAVFVTLYEVMGSRLMAQSEFNALPEHLELFKFGYGRMEETESTLAFDLRPMSHLQEWAGRLVVNWPGREVGWHRWASQNDFSVLAIHQDSILKRVMPEWQELVLSWLDLNSLPSAWRARLSEWRGVYLIYDVTSEQGYVGSASGVDNLLGRWLEYVKNGHGGNVGLRQSNPNNLLFSILQRTSPDLPKDEVERLELSWKIRLHTREHGLNRN